MGLLLGSGSHWTEQVNALQILNNLKLLQGYEDPHKTLPSVVVHIRGLVDGVTEADLVEALQEFGAIR